MKKIKKIALGSLIILMIYAYLAAICDYGYMEEDCFVLRILLALEPKSKDNLVAAFNALWSVAVTVTIFVLEISEQYKYGVPLKRIVFEALGKRWLCAGVVFFLLLFPMFYFFMKFSCMQMGLWCLCAAFVTFIATIALFAWMYRGEHIRGVIRVRTQEQILELAEESRISDHQDDRRIWLHEAIDGMAISDMLDHVDYGNADEVSGLVDMCRGIFQLPRLWNKLHEGMLDNLIINAWADRIIHSCEWNTEYDCIRNINTLNLLRENIIGAVLSDSQDKDNTELRNENDHQKEISICLQFLQPFVNENNEKNDRMLVRVWREFGIYRKQVLVYLLLYTAYRSYRLETADYTWILRDEPAFRNCMREILAGSFVWDEQTAAQYWYNWSCYDYHEDINFAKFKDFSNDIENLRRGKRYKMKSPILIHAVGGIESWEKQ